MEKIRVGWSMSTKWSDPPMVLMFGLIGILLTILGSSIALAVYTEVYFAVIPFLVSFIGFKLYMRTGKANTAKYLIFKDAGLKAKYSKNKIPISTLYENFIRGKIDLNGDCFEILEHRDEFISYKITRETIVFLLSQFIPIPGYSSSFHGQSDDKEQIHLHYDRGNDFFEAFLGPAMVYTSGVFYGLDQTLETAQANKMSLICDKLQLKENETMLDIGCGWGTLARHGAKYYGAQTTGVTLSVEGAAWCNEKNAAEGIEDKCEILCKDYRDIPNTGFNKISSIEMAEHVGIKNFPIYLKKVKDLLADDGLFLMQVAGLRQGSDWQDIAWGLFMSKYIFPGADASTPLNWYILQLEKAGFEVRSVETIGKHYSHTLHRWYLNWLKNRAPMTEKYGESLYRLWEIFLSWSVVAAGQGSATCYQILVNKNIKTFDRDIYTTKDVPNVGIYRGKRE